MTLFFLTALLASAAVPADTGPDLRAASAALEPSAASASAVSTITVSASTASASTASTNAVSAGAATVPASWTAALSDAGFATARPAAEPITAALGPSGPARAAGAAPGRPSAEQAAAGLVPRAYSSSLLSPGLATVDQVLSEKPARDCSPRPAHSLQITDTSPASVSLEVSKAAFDCANEVGLAFADDSDAIATLTSLELDGPLLLADARLSFPLIKEVRRLRPQRVVAVGIDRHIARVALSGFEVEHVEVDEGSSPDRVWIVDPEDATTLAAVAAQVGAGVVEATGDLRALPRKAREALSAASEVDLLTDLGEDAAWQLEVVRRGEELPGGGLLLFEPGDESPGRRMVAAYGHPSTRALGVLGEQGPEDAVERLRTMAEGYDADGSEVLPVFEIIATVASAGPGADRDYSSMTDLEVIRPWIETAADNGVYVVLDLQPGRSNYLSQAKHYEEFLRLPHVGLALDPEWRLKPHQVHLAQIGTVDAAEINRVVDWLADIVRDEALPQKLLILHQFRYSMITNRDKVETPSELAVLIHMDGQGPLTAKYNTWNALTSLADADRFHWGWKNFYDEDSPMATPEQVLELSPDIVFVSFQ